MNSHPPEHIFNCARVIRSCLSLLIQEHKDLDLHLSRLLMQELNDTIAREILDLLGQQQETRLWMANYLEYEANASPRKYRDTNSLHLPIGESQPTPATSKYACPRCGLHYFRRGVGQRIKTCSSCDDVQYEPVLATYRCPQNDYVAFTFDENTPLRPCHTHKNLELILCNV